MKNDLIRNLISEKVMQMDRVQLETFLAVLETGSFSGAGQRLNSVQSNVTSRIRRLEDDLGGMLFERGRSGARLTALGERLEPHARDILGRLTAAEAELRDAAGGAAPLRLGALETVAGARLPPLLKALHAAHPSSDITLLTGPQGQLLSDLWERRVDAAFVAAPADAERFQAVAAFQERLVIARPRGGAPVDTLLAFPAGCIYRAAAEGWLRREGKADLVVRDMGSLESILGLVEAGLGFAVAPESAVAGYRAAEALDLLPLPGAAGRSEIVLAWRHDHRPTSPHRRLIDLLGACQGQDESG